MPTISEQAKMRGMMTSQKRRISGFHQFDMHTIHPQDSIISRRINYSTSSYSSNHFDVSRSRRDSFKSNVSPFKTQNSQVMAQSQIMVNQRNKPEDQVEFQKIDNRKWKLNESQEPMLNSTMKPKGIQKDLLNYEKKLPRERSRDSKR